jgi:hypothetical protein
MVSVLVSSVVYREYEPISVQSNELALDKSN